MSCTPHLSRLNKYSCHNAQVEKNFFLFLMHQHEWLIKTIPISMTEITNFCDKQSLIQFKCLWIITFDTFQLKKSIQYRSFWSINHPKFFWTSRFFRVFLSLSYCLVFLKVLFSVFFVRWRMKKCVAEAHFCDKLLFLFCKIIVHQLD